MELLAAVLLAASVRDRHSMLFFIIVLFSHQKSLKVERIDNNTKIEFYNNQPSIVFYGCFSIFQPNLNYIYMPSSIALLTNFDVP